LSGPHRSRGRAALAAAKTAKCAAPPFGPHWRRADSAPFPLAKGTTRFFFELLHFLVQIVSPPLQVLPRAIQLLLQTPNVMLRFFQGQKPVLEVNIGLGIGPIR